MRYAFLVILSLGMYISVHGTIGAIVGSTTGSVGVAFLLGAISHLVFDFIPHGDMRSDEVFRYLLKERDPEKRGNFAFRLAALCDTLLLTVLSGFVLFRGGGDPLPVAAGILGAIFPDLLMGVEEVLRRHAWFGRTPLAWMFERFHALHYGTHLVLPDPPYLVGFGVQVLLLVVSLRFLLL